LDELRKKPEYRNITFLRINYDTEQQFRSTYNVPVRSAILLFKGGKEARRLVGDGETASIEGLLRAAR
jgi:hypothetical protein